MPRLPLIGGAYAARSVIANSQRAINYFPEVNRKDAPSPTTHYQRPGLRPLVVPAELGPGRGLFQASNGNGFTAIGSKFYSIGSDFALTFLGNLSPGRSNPVSFADNGTDALVVDGSNQGFTCPIAGGPLVPFFDPNFSGATRADFLDTFVIWNELNSRRFWATPSGVLSPISSSSFGAKSVFPDLLRTLIVRKAEIVLLGALKGEIWYNVGGAQFPFARMQGAYIEHGIAADYSVAASDLSVFWLARDHEGQGLVLRLRSYQTTAISNFAICDAISKMERIDDAVGYTYQQGGHLFYVLNFPSADQTWVFDDSIADPELAWHQRCWTDLNGVLHRERANNFAMINNVPCVGDWQNGTIYALDRDQYFDTVLGQDYAMTCIRSFPHITQGYDPQGQLVSTDGKSVQFKSFIADVDVGHGSLDAAGNAGRLGLRWSDDKGKTWGQTALISNGEPGQFATTEKWDGLGVSPHRIFELSHSINGQVALNGAYVDAVVLKR